MQWFFQNLRPRVILIFFVLHFVPTFGIELPWSDTRPPVSPWGHSERQEARETWFRGLSWDNVFKARQPKGKAMAMNDEIAAPPQTLANREVGVEEKPDIPDSSDLSEIPWETYEEAYPAENFKSKLMWPVEDGKISSGYGFRSGRVHEGIDIKAPLGNSVRAAADGRVVYSGVVSGYGKITVVYHGRGIASVYAHNAINLKKRGDQVRQGDTIAHVGQSGEASGSHCHFEIRENGKPTNPLRFTYVQSPLFAQR